MRVPYLVVGALLPIAASAARTITSSGFQTISVVTAVSVSPIVSPTPIISVIDENIVAVYVFHRHGDRTAKTHPPANLTALGYDQVYNSGSYYRSRYVDSGAPYKILNISPDVVVQSQVAVSAPSDTVLQNSAMGFLQALYPPAQQLAEETLRNGTTIQPPLNGYQLIPVGLVQSGSASEDTAWLQDTTDCGNAETSSQEFYQSPEYNSLYQTTLNFYQTWDPMINGTFNSSSTNYKNAYTIYDLVNVASVHNITLSGADILDDPNNLLQLRTLADQHEFNLAFNASSPIRGIAGMQLAAEVVNALNTSILSGGNKPALTVQFGNYATMLSYFGLAGLAGVNEDMFYGIPDYASSLVWEVYYNGTVTPNPSPDDLYVRFLFHNGSATAASPPEVFPLFGQAGMNLRWADFVSSTSNFSIGTTEQWCVACGNVTGTCTQYAGEVLASGTLPPAASSSAAAAASSAAAVAGDCGGQSSGGGLSNAVAGVIGAMVTLGVILGVELLVLLLYCCGCLGGWRSYRRRPARRYGGGVSYSGGAGYSGYRGGGIGPVSTKSYGVSLDSSAGLGKAGGAFAGFSEKDSESHQGEYDEKVNGSLDARRSFSPVESKVKRLPNGMATSTLGRGASSNLDRSGAGASTRTSGSTTHTASKGNGSALQSSVVGSGKGAAGGLATAVGAATAGAGAGAGVGAGAAAIGSTNRASGQRSKNSRRMPKTLRGPPASRFDETEEYGLGQQSGNSDLAASGAIGTAGASGYSASGNLMAAARGLSDNASETTVTRGDTGVTKYATKTLTASGNTGTSGYQIANSTNESDALGGGSTTKYITKTITGPGDAGTLGYQVASMSNESHALGGGSAAHGGALIQQSGDGSEYKIIKPSYTVETAGNPDPSTVAATMAAAASATSGVTSVTVATNVNGGGEGNETETESYQSYNTATGRQRGESMDDTETSASYQSFDTVQGGGTLQTESSAGGSQTYVVRTSGGSSEQYANNQVTNASNFGGLENIDSSRNLAQSGSYSYSTQSGDGAVTYFTTTTNGSNAAQYSSADGGRKTVTKTWQTGGGSTDETVTKTIITRSLEDGEWGDSRDFGFGLHG